MKENQNECFRGAIIIETTSSSVMKDNRWVWGSLRTHPDAPIATTSFLKPKQHRDYNTMWPPLHFWTLNNTVIITQCGHRAISLLKRHTPAWLSWPLWRVLPVPCLSTWQRSCRQMWIWQWPWQSNWRGIINDNKRTVGDGSHYSFNQFRVSGRWSTITEHSILWKK